MEKYQVTCDCEYAGLGELEVTVTAEGKSQSRRQSRFGGGIIHETKCYLTSDFNDNITARQCKHTVFL
jgi:hypothetical protein